MLQNKYLKKIYIKFFILVICISFFNIFSCKKKYIEFLKLKYSWEINKSSFPINITIHNKDNLWTTDENSKLIELQPSKEKNIYSLMYENKLLKIRYVEPLNKNYLWVTFFDTDNKNKLAKWKIGDSSIELVLIPKEPEKILWINNRKELWYIASDLSLNILKNAKSVTIDKFKYSDMVSNEKIIACNRISNGGDYEIFFSKINNLKWRKILFDKRKFQRIKLVGIDENDSIILFSYFSKSSKTSHPSFHVIDNKNTINNFIYNDIFSYVKLIDNKLITMKYINTDRMLISLFSYDFRIPSSKF